MNRCTQCNAEQEPVLNEDGVYMWDCTNCGSGLSWLPDNPSPEYLAAWKMAVLKNWMR